MGGPCASLMESSRGLYCSIPVWGYGLRGWSAALVGHLGVRSLQSGPSARWCHSRHFMPPGKGPLSGLNSSVGYNGAGSPLLRPVPLLPFSNTSCGFLT